ncbi:helix-turn-helix domain-containing protein [Streptomyces lavenduligriseus]|nr:helix-turn-helix domain-containing protein [Streptomyces lavenduligriseus]
MSSRPLRYPPRRRGRVHDGAQHQRGRPSAEREDAHHRTEHKPALRGRSDPGAGRLADRHHDERRRHRPEHHRQSSPVCIGRREHRHRSRRQQEQQPGPRGSRGGRARRVAAHALGPHPDTVDNRLARTAERTRIDLSSPEGTATVIAALQLRETDT